MSETFSMFNKKKWLPLVYIPVKISHRCCGVMKKAPLHTYQKTNKVVPILGTMAQESRIRRQGWIRKGCNAYDGDKSMSTPMAFWTEQDVLEYIAKYGLEIASVYGDVVSMDKHGEICPALDITGHIPTGCKLCTTNAERTGCMFCGFGLHLEKGETRFQKLKRTHPKQYDYCIRGGQWIDNPDYVPDALEYDGVWKNWNPEKIWVPGNGGLGFGKVFEMVNEIYGDDFYRWE